MKWVEVAVEGPVEAAEVLAAALGELTEGVEVRDAGTLIAAAAGRVAIVTQCRPEAEADVLAELDACATRLRLAGVAVDPLVVRRRDAHEDEWRDVWKQFFRATRVGRTLLVRPSWDPQPGAPDDRIIDIDPGRAFGTGGHATTRLVMAMCEDLADRPVRRFLDLGCGSGILSMAAARIWPAARGVAVDVDPEAVATTRENLERNAITTVEARVAKLDDIVETFDLVLANIEAAVLTPLASQFAARSSPRGAAVLSGLLRDQGDAVAAAFEAAGFAVEARRAEDEWVALGLSR
jgi:ribosomal protein L11 methyltransferase